MYGLYLLALVLLAQPLIETAAATWPLRPGLVGWRFAFTGIFYTMLPTTMVALFIAAGTSWLLGHRAVLRTVAVLTVVLGGVIALLTVSFGLDALQMRKLVRPEANAGFDAASLKALLTAGLAIIACVSISIGVFRATRRPAGTAHRLRQPGEGLIIGRPQKGSQQAR
jgi:chromate transport protein ChrA